jgi:hypothetical protein
MWQGLDPRIRTVWTVAALIAPAVLTLVAAGMIFVGVPVVPWVLAVVAVILIFLGIFVPSARWRSWAYRLTDTELIIRFGVLIRVQRWLPRTRIQHVDIVGGPIERALGLRQIVIYTAGTREADVKLPGLQTEIAEQLRVDLLSWVTSTVPETDPVAWSDHDTQADPTEASRFGGADPTSEDGSEPPGSPAHLDEMLGDGPASR